MKKSFLALISALMFVAPASARFENNPIIFPEEYYTNHSMGCLMLGDCRDEVVEIHSRQDVYDYFGDGYQLPQEFDEILSTLKKINVKVFIASTEYFPVGHRGVYHTVENNFFLNSFHVKRPHTMMSVMRHEGWHAAQDCMAGGIENNYIGVIFTEDKIPEFWKDIAKDTYPQSALPWEQEATWAGRTEKMTLEALNACAAGNMWENPDFPPTPLTRQFLIDQGFIKN